MTIGPGDERWGTGRSQRRSGYRTRSYYLPDDLHFRLRNAWWHTQARVDSDSLSGLVAAALWPVVEELESRYNSGRPFPELPRGGRLVMGPRRRRSPGPGTASASPPSPRSRGQDGEHARLTTSDTGRVAPKTGVHRRGEAAGGGDNDRSDRHEEHGPLANGHPARGRQSDHGQPGEHRHRAAVSPQQSSGPVEEPQGTGEQA